MSQIQFTETVTSVKEDVTDVINANALDAEARLAALVAADAVLTGSVDLKAPLVSPALTGTPSAPTASPANSTTQLATTAFVQQELLVVSNAIPTSVYGIMSCQNGSTAETTTNATPRKVTAWNTDGVASGVVVDNTDDSITAVHAGVYHVNCNIAFSGDAGDAYQVALYVYDDSASSWIDTGFALDRVLGNGDVGSAGLSGIVTLDANDQVAVYHSSSTGGVTFTVHEAQLVMHKL